MIGNSEPVKTEVNATRSSQQKSCRIIRLGRKKLLLASALAALALSTVCLFAGCGSPTAEEGSPDTSSNTLPPAADIETSETSTNISEEDSPKPEGTIAAPTAAHWPPTFTSFEASSQLPGDEKDADYGPAMAVDGNMQTAWNTYGDSVGSGEGQWIELRAEEPQKVQGLRIMPGFCKNEDIYIQNRRPARVTVTLDGGTSASVDISDYFGSFQEIAFNSARSVSTVRITIDATYPGRFFDDCCISEIEVF